MVRSAISLIVLLVIGPTGLPGQELQFAEMRDCDLENGGVILNCSIGYRTVGTLNPDRSNAVLFPTWFGGTSEEILGLLGPEGRSRGRSRKTKPRPSDKSSEPVRD